MYGRHLFSCGGLVAAVRQTGEHHFNTDSGHLKKFGEKVLHKEKLSSHDSKYHLQKKQLYCSSKNITHSKKQKFICFLRSQDSFILHRTVSFGFINLVPD